MTFVSEEALPRECGMKETADCRVRVLDHRQLSPSFDAVFKVAARGCLQAREVLVNDFSLGRVACSIHATRFHFSGRVIGSSPTAGSTSSIGGSLWRGGKYGTRHDIFTFSPTERACLCYLSWDMRIGHTDHIFGRSPYR